MRDRILELLIKCNLGNDPASRWYVTPDIPPKKLDKAIESYGSHIAPEEVIALADGTILGSGKAGIVLSATTLHTMSDGQNLSIPFDHIMGTSDVSKMTSSEITLHCKGADVKIDSTFFDKKHAELISFFGELSSSSGTSDENKMDPSIEVIRAAPEMASLDYSMSSDEVSKQLAGVVFFGGDDYDDFEEKLRMSLNNPNEVPIAKGLCNYLGFGAQNVMGLFLVTNKRCLLFSLESGLKNVVLGLTKRFLGKVPLLGWAVDLLFIELPRFLLNKIFNYRLKRAASAIVLDEQNLLSGNTGLKNIQDFDFQRFSQYVRHIEIGKRVPTGLLSYGFGISFMQRNVTQAWTKPKDWLMPQDPELPPYTALVKSALSELEAAGISVEFEGKKIQLNLPNCD